MDQGQKDIDLWKRYLQTDVSLYKVLLIYDRSE